MTTGGCVVGDGVGFVPDSLGQPSSSPVASFTQSSTSKWRQYSVVGLRDFIYIMVLTEHIGVDTGILRSGTAIAPRGGANDLEAPEACICEQMQFLPYRMTHAKQ